MANNKVQLSDGTVLLDLTGDTVTPETLMAGVIAHNAAGERIVGTAVGIKLTGIAITTPPTKIAYNAGEIFDPAGMVVTATYSNGAKLTNPSYTFSPAGALSAGDTAITITYTEGGVTKTATQAISVKAIIIYGVSWDGSSSPQLTRTDASANFPDPVAYMAGISNYGSPFDNIMPWSGMVRSTRACGEVVSIPKFWYKLTQNGAGVNIQITNEPLDGFSVCPACMDRGDGKGERDVVYVGRYHCAAGTYKSTTGVKPAETETRSAFRTNIHNLGSTVWQMDFATRFTIWLLYIVEYANWNSQAVIGIGCGDNNYSIVNMGYTDSMPYHTGTMLSSRTAYASSTQYRHIEGLWDNVLDGCDGAYNDDNGLNIILDPSKFSDSANGISVGTPTNGWIGGFAVKNVSGTYPILISSSENGSDSTYVCDRWNFKASEPCLFVGGFYFPFFTNGLFSVNCFSASSADDARGSRLMDLAA